jgi:hypothetical protein
VRGEEVVLHRSSSFAALVLALGVALGGWFVGRGFVEGRASDRFVTVKGVAEREIEADLALWPLQYVATDNDLGRAQQKIEASRKAILTYLAGRGVDAEHTQLQGLRVEDRLARSMGQIPVESRFTITQTLMVRSDDPAMIRTASQGVGELVDAGVVLASSGGWSGGPTYVFSRLNDFKPEMIAEATASAREAAEKFAQDSGERVGAIRRANQGVFQILPRDPAPGVSEENQLEKTLRVVTTVDYLLE